MLVYQNVNELQLNVVYYFNLMFLSLKEHVPCNLGAETLVLCQNAYLGSC